MTAPKRRPITNNPFANASPVRAPEYEHVPGQMGIEMEGAPPADVPATTPTPTTPPEEDPYAEERSAAKRRAEERKQIPGVPAPAPEPSGTRRRVAGGRFKLPARNSDLFVTMPWNLHAGMKELAVRKGTTLKQEVIDAFEAHFEAHDYTPPPAD